MIIKWPWTRSQVEAVRPDMTRRRFLATLAAVPVAAAIAPELLDLLKPPKVISLPSTGMARYSDGWTHPGGLFARGPMTNAQFREYLRPGLNDVFSKQYAMHPGEWQEMFNNDLNKVALDAEVYGFGMAQVKQEGGAILYDHVPAEMVYKHQEYALGFQIVGDTHEDLTDYDALVRARHSGGCSNQNALNPEGMYRGAAECSCNQVDELPRGVDRFVQSVNALPAAAEDLARDIVSSPIDLVKRILRL